MAIESYRLDGRDESEGQTLRRSKKSLRATVTIVVVVVIVIAAVSATVAAIIIKDAAAKKAKQKQTRSNPILIVSLDGFRWDYFKRGLSPNLSRIAKDGVVADFLQAQFPTKTFPNHYSIATGLYPESHGIVANTFLDGNRKDLFKIGGKTANDGKWWGGEPIWVTAIKQGRKSASYFWVGSEAPVQGIRPSYWMKYNKTTPYQERVRQVLEWLSYGSEDIRPSIVTLYYYQPDSAGHSFGPNSPQVNKAIGLVDDMIGLLFNGLKEKGLEDKVNLIILTDHGMTDVDCSRVVYLDQFSKLENVSVVGQGSFGYIYAKTAAAAKQVYDDLKCGHANLRAFAKSGIYTPKRMHHMNNKHSGDISLVPNPGWSFLKRNGSCRPNLKGAHGYDNLAVEMRGIFVARGPAFKKGYNAGHFENTEVYNLMCGLLGLKPAPNNGTFGSLYHLLNSERRKVMPTPKFTGDGNNFAESCSDGTPGLCTAGDYICPYCSYTIKNNITDYQQHLILSKDLIEKSRTLHFPFGLPQGGAGSSSSGCILTQRYYVTGYSKKLHIPLWVGYRLTKEQLEVNVPRKNCFRRDPRLHPKDSSNCTDYSGSNYDRGHMAPLGDFNFERYSEQDTNVFSNIVPQHKAFNRRPGLWYQSEELIRDWAMQYGLLYVISGSIFDADNDGLRDDDDAEKRWLHDRKGGVAIPTHYYKILVRCLVNVSSDYTVPGCKGTLDVLSFILPHQEESLCKLRSWQAHLMDYVASIRDIERITGTLFFPSLPSILQAELKTKIPLKLWPNALV